MNQFDMRCPQCGSADEIEIEVRVWARLTHDGTDADGDHIWDDNSKAQCQNCGHEGTAAQYERRTRRNYRVV